MGYDKKCTICLGDLEEVQDIINLFSACMQRFHADCIEQWTKYHHTCPICKAVDPVIQRQQAQMCNLESLVGLHVILLGRSTQSLYRTLETP
jgi:hypothetical protein